MDMCNASLVQACLPITQRHAIVTQRLKKAGADPTDMRNYRPISNLTFLSKIVEKLVSAARSLPWVPQAHSVITIGLLLWSFYGNSCHQKSSLMHLWQPTEVKWPYLECSTYQPHWTPSIILSSSTVFETHSVLVDCRYRGLTPSSHVRCRLSVLLEVSHQNRRKHVAYRWGASLDQSSSCCTPPTC